MPYLDFLAKVAATCLLIISCETNTLEISLPYTCSNEIFNDIECFLHHPGNDLLWSKNQYVDKDNQRK